MRYQWLLILWLPIFAAGADSQRYIVELSGDPIAEHVAKERKRTGKHVAMDGDEARTRAKELRSEQRQVRAAIEQKNGKSFAQSFGGLSASCSNCHEAANHPFVKIQAPTDAMFSNQKFAP